jgi:PAS domain S-box-containing protein
MFKASTQELNTLKSVLAALDHSQAMIEFKMDGTIITANDNFLKAMGYSLDEIQGKHHSIFVPEKERQSAPYHEFWRALNRGEYQAAEYKRIGKGGKDVWIQATYNPIKGEDGKPFKFATDVTERKMKDADAQAKLDAIGNCWRSERDQRGGIGHRRNLDDHRYDQPDLRNDRVGSGRTECRDQGDCVQHANGFRRCAIH